MSNKNPQINVTFEEKTTGILSKLAHKQNRSIASLVRELALEALELREDIYFSELAEKLDSENTITHEHDAVWNHKQTTK